MPAARAYNAELTQPIVDALLAVLDDNVGRALARRTEDPAVMLELFRRGGRATQDEVAENPMAPMSVHELVAAGDDAGRRHRVAYRTVDVEPQLLYAKSEDAETRRWLSENPALKPEAAAALAARKA